MSELVTCILIVRYTYHFEKIVLWGKTSPVLNKEGLMNEIKIRKASLPDLEQLLVFEQDLIKTERPFDPTVKPDPVTYYDLKAMLTDQRIEMVVAEVNNKVIASGYARIDHSKPYSRHSQQAYFGFMY